MKRPSFQYYPGDWVRSLDIRSCSLAARGLWLEMMNLMHEAEPYGYLVINNKPISLPVLARMVGATQSEIEPLLDELEALGVYSKDENGAIYCRRMVRDEKFRRTRASNGKLGGYHTHKKKVSTKRVPNIVPNVVPNQNQEQYLTGTPSSSSSSSSSSSEKDNNDNGPTPSGQSIFEIAERLKQDEGYLMVTANYIRKPGLKTGPPWIVLMLDKFVLHLQSEEKIEKTIHEFKRHFKEWLKFQQQPTPINNEIY